MVDPIGINRTRRRAFFTVRFDSPDCSKISVRMEKWWTQSGSNRRPLACHASALPAELWAHQNGWEFWCPVHIQIRINNQVIIANLYRTISSKVTKRKAGHDPKKIRCGCCLSALTGLARFSPAPTFRHDLYAKNPLASRKNSAYKQKILMISTLPFRSPGQEKTCIKKTGSFLPV